MKFELEESGRGISDEELLDDMRRCAKTLGRDTITIAEYEEVGKAHPCTIQRRFGAWPDALELAGLQPSRSKIGIADEELFENLKSLWINLGRQPRYAEVKKPSSQFSQGHTKTALARGQKHSRHSLHGSTLTAQTKASKKKRGSETVDSTIQRPQQNAAPAAKYRSVRGSESW